MFNNIGGKIMGLAKIFCWLGIISSIIGGIAVILINMDAIEYGYGTPFILLGIGIMLVGSLISWIGSFFTYGFGQLIQNSDYIRYNTGR